MCVNSVLPLLEHENDFCFGLPDWRFYIINFKLRLLPPLAHRYRCYVHELVVIHLRIGKPAHIRKGLILPLVDIASSLAGSRQHLIIDTFGPLKFILIVLFWFFILSVNHLLLQPLLQFLLLLLPWIGLVNNGPWLHKLLVVVYLNVDCGFLRSWIIYLKLIVRVVSVKIGLNIKWLPHRLPRWKGEYGFVDVVSLDLNLLAHFLTGLVLQHIDISIEPALRLKSPGLHGDLGLYLLLRWRIMAGS